jgi:hypothetical protein
MGLTAHPVALKEKSRNLCNAFLAGAPKDAYGHVFYGVDNTNWDAWRRVCMRKEPFWYIDNSYFDSVRGQQFRATRNAIQVQDALAKTSTGERFAALGLEIQPWRLNPDGYWLVIEQSPAFMERIAGDKRWLEKMAAGFDPDRTMKVRRWKPDKLMSQATLAADLAGAWTLVTHSSAAAVTATLAGVPANVSRMSALAHMVCSTTDEKTDQRRHYMNVLADNQFTVQEMEDGTAWKMLNR